MNKEDFIRITGWSEYVAGLSDSNMGFLVEADLKLEDIIAILHHR